MAESLPMGQELPPLLARPKSMMGRTLGYSDLDMREYALEAIAPYAERIRHLERELEVANRCLVRAANESTALRTELEQSRAAFKGSENARKVAERAAGLAED